MLHGSKTMIFPTSFITQPPSEEADVGDIQGPTIRSPWAEAAAVGGRGRELHVPTLVSLFWGVLYQSDSKYRTVHTQNSLSEDLVPVTSAFTRSPQMNRSGP